MPHPPLAAPITHGPNPLSSSRRVTCPSSSRHLPSRPCPVDLVTAAYTAPVDLIVYYDYLILIALVYFKIFRVQDKFIFLFLCFVLILFIYFWGGLLLGVLTLCQWTSKWRWRSIWAFNLFILVGWVNLWGNWNWICQLYDKI